MIPIYLPADFVIQIHFVSEFAFLYLCCCLFYSRILHFLLPCPGQLFTCSHFNVKMCLIVSSLCDIHTVYCPRGLAVIPSAFYMKCLFSPQVLLHVHLSKRHFNKHFRVLSQHLKTKALWHQSEPLKSFRQMCESSVSVQPDTLAAGYFLLNPAIFRFPQLPCNDASKWEQLQ